MAINRRLTAQISALLTTQYRNVEVLLNPTNLLDNLNVDFSQELSDGSGLDRIDLQWYDRRTLVDATEILVLDGGLTNNWGDVLDFDAIKCLIIHNRETDVAPLKLLEVHFKDEIYYIGPGGTRYVIEPGPGGILSIVSSASQEEGSITITANANVTYDIIILGSQNESSSG